MKDTILQEMGEQRRTATELTLKEEPITVMLQTTCKEIRGNQVIVSSAEGEQVLDAVTIIMAIGSRPRPSDELKAVCDTMNIPYHVIGDAVAAPRLGMDAIREAFKAAFTL